MIDGLNAQSLARGIEGEGYVPKMARAAEILLGAPSGLDRRALTSSSRRETLRSVRNPPSRPHRSDGIAPVGGFRAGEWLSR